MTSPPLLTATPAGEIPPFSVSCGVPLEPMCTTFALRTSATQSAAGPAVDVGCADGRGVGAGIEWLPPPQAASTAKSQTGISLRIESPTVHPPLGTKVRFLPDAPSGTYVTAAATASSVVSISASVL